MSAALAPSPPPTPGATTAPTNLGRVLALVRCLIGFGRRFADNLRQGGIAGLEFSYRAGLFGTADVATILLRIARGLRRAAALEALLLARAQRGRELKVAPVRLSMPRLPAFEPREPRTPLPPLPLEPTDEEIAADVRRRPVGAVIVEICHDLGVQPGDLGRDMHQELMNAVMFYGGNPIRLLRMDDAARRAREYIELLRSGAPLPPEHQPFPFLTQLAATGPPT